VFGDSHVFSGIGLYLGEDLKKQNNIYEYYGVSGSSFTNNFMGKKKELLNRINKFKPDIIICFMGTNEMYYNKSGYSNLLNSVNLFLKDIDKKKLIIVSLPYYEYKSAKNVSEGLKTFSKKNNIKYIDIFNKKYSELNLLSDKYHFNQQGYKNISEHINTLLK
jgi:lysophospholipase L1-like esterase